MEGLEEVPPDDRPPVGVVRNSFQLMVAIGTALAALGAVHLFVLTRRGDCRHRDGSSARSWPPDPAALVALIAGWITTEVGRQPWIVYEVMRTEQAVTGADGVPVGYGTLALVYAGPGRDRAFHAAQARRRPPVEIEAAGGRPRSGALPQAAREVLLALGARRGGPAAAITAYTFWAARTSARASGI